MSRAHAHHLPEVCCPKRALPLHLLLDGDLPPGDVAKLREHVGECTNCRAYLSWLEFEDELLRPPDPTLGFEGVWADQLVGKLADAAGFELDVEFLLWVASWVTRHGTHVEVRAPEGRPARPSDDALRHRLGVATAWAAAADSSVSTSPATPPHSLTLSQALRAYQKSRGRGGRATVWSLVLVTAARGEVDHARALARRLSPDTPPALFEALHGWIDGEQPPLAFGADQTFDVSG